MAKSQLRVKQISPKQYHIKLNKQQKWTLKNCLANEFSKSTIVIRFNLLQVCPSVPPFAVVVVFISSFLCSELLLLCFTEFGGGSYRSNFEKFRDAALLGCEQTDATTPNIVAPTMLGVVACVLAVVCKRMQQLPTMLRQQCWELHRGKDTTHKS